MSDELHDKITRHRASVDSFYANVAFDTSACQSMAFPLRDIEGFNWNRGHGMNEYFNYFFRRFSVHILSRLRLSDGNALLNIGCGRNWDAKNIAWLHPSIDMWSIDISRMMLEDARTSGVDSPMAVAASEALPFPDGTFDRVLSREVIEHVASPLAMLREIYRVLVPGGIAVITTENPHAWTPATRFETRWSRKRHISMTMNIPGSCIDEPPFMETLEELASVAGLELADTVFDGALYHFLAKHHARCGTSPLAAAHYFSRLESNPHFARIFCDQVKYVLIKPKAIPDSPPQRTPVAYACPSCRTRLTTARHALICPSCREEYPDTGIPELIPRATPYYGADSDHSDNPACKRAFDAFSDAMLGAYEAFFLKAAQHAATLCRIAPGLLSVHVAPDDPLTVFLRP